MAVSDRTDRRELTQRMGSALRVCRLHEPGNLAIEEAIADLFPVLDRYLDVRRRSVLLKEDDRIYLDERFMGAGHSDGGWIAEMGQVLGQLGIGALIVSGSWTSDDLRRVFAAFGSARGSPDVCRDQIVAGIRDVSARARIALLGPDEARHLGVDHRAETTLRPAAQADFLYARLSALAESMHSAAADGGSPDEFEGLIRQSLMDVVDGLESRTFEWRLLALPLLPPLPRLASHAADVATLSLAMGRLLGLERGDLIDLGYAAFFSSLGRAGRAEPGSSREVTQEGVLRALRGHVVGHAGARRLIVCRELFSPSPESHPFTLVVGVADAYARLVHGLLGVEAQVPHAALEAVRTTHHPAVVELLCSVLGRYPAGSFLRLQDGAIAITLDGSARRGRPRGRLVMSAGGEPSTGGDPCSIEVSSVAEVIDPRAFGVKPWKLVLGGGGAEDEEDHLALPSSPPAASRISLREREAVRLFLEGIVKTIRFHRLYPKDHPLCAKGVAEMFESASALLGVRASLELRLTRAGTAIGPDLIQATQSGTTDLAGLLVPCGVRGLRFLQGLGRNELAKFVLSVAQVEDGGDDMLRRLWQEHFNHIKVVVYDPLSPTRVRRPVDPTLEPVAAVIRDLLAALPPGDLALERKLERDWEIEEKEEGVAAEACGAWPEWIPLFLQSDAGQARATFLEQLDGGARADLRRAGGVVAWAATKLAVTPEETARARGALISKALTVRDHGLAQELVREAKGASERLDPLSSLRVATDRNLEALAQHLERAQLDSAAVGGVLELLRSLDDVAIAPTCEFYEGLTGKVELREIFATFLLDRIEARADDLVPLTLARDEQIAREALLLLGQAGAGSRGFALLEEFSADQRHKDRAVAAAKLLDQVTGAGARRAALKGVLEGKDSAERVKQTRRLAKVGDAQSYEALVELVRRRDFPTRPSAEVEALLEALAQLGQSRAVPVLRELAGTKTRGLLGVNKSAQVVARVAEAVLAKLRARKKQGTETVRIQTGACPKCRFSNVPGAARCLQCGTSLDGSAPKRKPTSHDTIRMKKEDLLARVETMSSTMRTKRPTSSANSARPPMTSSDKTQRIPRATTPAKPTTAKARAWLSYPLLPAVPLADEVVTIGRLASCDLVLVHESVSRTHVVLRPTGKSWVLEDRSSYGTWVNGERALSKPVAPGDVITIGPYDIKIEGEESQADPNAVTRTLRTFASSEAVGGRLERVSLSEVIQQLEFNQKTGTLEVFGEDGVNGVLVVYDGKPMFSEMGQLRDVEAVIAMLNMKKGNFSFRAKIEAGEMTMSTSLTGVLMEASRRMDEGD